MEKDLQERIIEEFSWKNTQEFYVAKAEDWFWDSEEEVLKEYFLRKKSVLDVGCGTGRTTIAMHFLWLNVIWVDITPTMIENAKKIAKAKELNIKYQVWDATNLDFEDESFDYALFSNQWWTQIPGKENRQTALQEIYRILKKEGRFIFTTHPRVFKGEFRMFWIKQWIRFYIMKPLWFPIEEQDFGDRFFDRETSDTQKTYKDKQYIHIPKKEEVVKELKKAWFIIRTIKEGLQISSKDIREYPPMFFVCQKK